MTPQWAAIVLPAPFLMPVSDVVAWGESVELQDLTPIGCADESQARKADVASSVAEGVTR